MEEKYSLLCPRVSSIQCGTDSLLLKEGILVCVKTGDDEFSYLGKENRLSDYCRRLLGRLTACSVLRDLEEWPKQNSATVPIYLSISNSSIRDTKSESYELEINCSSITISSNSHMGQIRGLQTLYQILRIFRTNEQEFSILTAFIKDHPDFQNRGVLLDISRDRIPTLQYLKWLIENLSRMKINQFQLYNEHTFPYVKHESVWKQSNTYSKDEFKLIDEWCINNFIHFIPNQNTLGHMERWLKHSEYKHLAECPEGVAHPFSEIRQPFTLNPFAQGVEDLMDELLKEVRTSKTILIYP